MGPSGVVKTDPLSDDTHGVFLGFEAMTMHALFFQRSDNAFDHAVLLWAVRRDELLAKTVVAHDQRVGPRGKDQAVIRPQQERPVDAPEATEARDQRLLQRRRFRRRSAASRELPAQQFSRVAVDHERQGLPAITTGPDAAQIGGPTFVRRRHHRGQCFDSRS